MKLRFTHEGGRHTPPLQTSKYVEGEKEVQPEWTGKEKSPTVITKTPEEVASYVTRASVFLEGHRNFLATFSGDTSLKFKLADRFAIDLESGVVYSDGRWYAERGYSETQILWAHLHELMHFRDLADDPEGMKQNREYIGVRAKETGNRILKKWEEAFGETHPEFIEKLKVTRPIGKGKEEFNGPQAAAFRFHHTFFNAIDDIYVNKGVERRASRFEPNTAGGKEIQQLYREKLFANKDLRTQPSHLQFLYALLRDAMVKDEHSEPNEAVAHILADRNIAYKEKMHTPREIVDMYLLPRSGRDTKPGARYAIYRQTLEPIFLKLLEEDIESWEPKMPEDNKQSSSGGEGESSPEATEDPKGESGDKKPEKPFPKQETKGKPDPSTAPSGDPFSGEYDDFESASPDQLDEDEIEAWLDGKTRDEDDEGAEKPKPKEIDKDEQKKMDEAWCAENEIDPRLMEEYRALEAEVAPYLQELSHFWQQIIYGKSTERGRGVAGNFRTGTDIDIARTVERWPQISKGNYEDAHIMRRSTPVETVVQKPELIRVRLLADDSGSMAPPAKQRVLKQAIVLLESSLREFNTHLNLSRSQTRSKLRAESEIWKFGASAVKHKPFRQGNDFNGELGASIEALGKFQAYDGKTDDAQGLFEIRQSLSPAEIGDIAKKKIMEIVLEITDGGSTVPGETKSEIEKLHTYGVVVRALQIGTPDNSEKQIFHNVWVEGREVPLGSVVGKDLKNLLPALVNILKSYLKKVQL